MADLPDDDGRPTAEDMGLDDEPTKPGGLLARALRSDDLDEAILPIMDALGITTGDVSGAAFATVGEWLDLDLHARADAIVVWLRLEMVSAIEAVMEAP